MDSQQIDFLHSVRSLLLYHKTMGVADYPACEATRRFLEGAKTVCTSSVSGEEGPRNGIDPMVGSFQELTTGTRDHIAEEVRSCVSCDLHMKRLLPVPGHGGERPRVIFVGGWLTGEEGESIPTNRIFGREEDIMVSRMLAAMKLPPEMAFLTNIIKCAVPPSCQPTQENIQTCFSFLLRQIQVLGPEIICAMGIIATRALLKNTQPLSQLRGKFYPFAIAGERNIPVIPTYHPTLLFQNPELKRATWEDLQSIVKLLRL